MGIHPIRTALKADVATFARDAKESMLEEFNSFNKDLIKLFQLAEHVKCWPLAIHEPLAEWQYGKAILIGDAAHPVRPSNCDRRRCN